MSSRGALAELCAAREEDELVPAYYHICGLPLPLPLSSFLLWLWLWLRLRLWLRMWLWLSTWLSLSSLWMGMRARVCLSLCLRVLSSVPVCPSVCLLACLFRNRGGGRARVHRHPPIVVGPNVCGQHVLQNQMSARDVVAL